MNILDENVDMKAMPVSQKAKLATLLGEQVGKVMNRALIKCNKLLKKYGYSVSVDLKFHELEEN